MKKKEWLMPDFPRADIAGQLGNLFGEAAKSWTDGVVTIPRRGTKARREYNRRYLAAIIDRYGGPRFQLRPVRVDARKLVTTNPVVNKPRYEMYRRMISAGDIVPPLVVEMIGTPENPLLRVIDGNHRIQAAIDAKRYRLPALLLERT